MARTEKAGQRDRRRLPGLDLIYIVRASEAVAVTEIYSRLVGKPPKGLGQGATWPGLCLGVGYRMELEGQVARGFLRILAGDVGDLARVMRRQCDEQL